MPSQYLIKLLHKCSWWKQFNFHFCFIIEVLIVWHIISIFFLTGLIWIKSGYAAGCKKVLNYGGTNFPLPVNVTEHFPSPCSSDLHIIHIYPYTISFCSTYFQSPWYYLLCFVRDLRSDILPTQTVCFMWNESIWWDLCILYTIFMVYIHPYLSIKGFTFNSTLLAANPSNSNRIKQPSGSNLEKQKPGL